MNVIGAPPIRIVDQPTSQPVEFRVNQKITADILKVSGDQVTMVVQGQQVVGKVAGGDSTGLMGEQQAQFIVRGMVDGVLQLQVVHPDASTPASAAQVSQWTILAQNLLKLINLPVNNETLMMGRALLGAGLPITPELIANMQATLTAMPSWGQGEADVSASLLAKGIPLSTGSLSLALQQLPNLADAFQKLQTQLEGWLKTTNSTELKPLAEKALSVLQDAKVNWNASPADLSKQLSQAISTLGKSLESHLADMMKSGEITKNPGEADGMLALAFLQRGLEKEGNSALAISVNRFMDGLRQMQLLNTAQPNNSTNSTWMLINIPMTNLQQNDADTQSAHLKIAYREKDGEKYIDGANNRLVLTIDLDDGNSIEVDLSMVDKKIGAWLNVPDQNWQQIFEQELPSFEKKLEELGYQVQFAKCEVKPSATMLPVAYPVSKINLKA
jgi:hypothetical protein